MDAKNQALADGKEKRSRLSEDYRPQMPVQKKSKPVEDVEKIKIGRKFVEFRFNDPIFKLTEPVGPKLDDECCVFCERDMKD